MEVCRAPAQLGRTAKVFDRCVVQLASAVAALPIAKAGAAQWTCLNSILVSPRMDHNRAKPRQVKPVEHLNTTHEYNLGNSSQR
jgi:hypothetical protein